ncbi:MAG: hypothetical protein AVDCRST_MAG30-244, partial [uncultured Solirubrobacteraceae bacterium]
EPAARHGRRRAEGRPPRGGAGGDPRRPLDAPGDGYARLPVVRRPGLARGRAPRAARPADLPVLPPRRPGPRLPVARRALAARAGRRARHRPL